MQALPPARRVVGPWSDALSEIEEFYQEWSSSTVPARACV
jgi:hypothetical protein